LVGRDVERSSANRQSAGRSNDSGERPGEKAALTRRADYRRDDTGGRDFSYGGVIRDVDVARGIGGDGRWPVELRRSPRAVGDADRAAEGATGERRLYGGRRNLADQPIPCIGDVEIACAIDVSVLRRWVSALIAACAWTRSAARWLRTLFRQLGWARRQNINVSSASA
jgi:hypothetical protein